MVVGRDFSPLGGPAHRVLSRIGRSRDARGLLRTATTLSLLTWGPLLALSAGAGLLFSDAVTVSFARDLGAHVRFLIAVPLFLLADLVVGPQLTTIVQRLVESRLVSAADTPRLEAALDEVARRRDSRVAEATLLVLAYLIAWTATGTMRSGAISTWVATTSGAGVYLTAAGWWYVGVSAPVFVFLFLRWVWRGIVWSRFLARIARLDLGLVATHPDEAGGIAFLGSGQSAFGIVVFAFSAVLSGTIAERILYGGAHVMDVKAPLIGFVILAVATVFGPLLVLARPLGAARSAALARYSALLTAHHRAFETRWLDGRETAGGELLGSSDASSLADLGAAFEAVEKMQIVPIRSPAVVVVAACAVLPMLPAVALEVPLRDVLIKLMGILA